MAQSPAMLQLPGRSAKPRRRGLTSIIDFGPDTFGWTGPRGLADVLECAGPYIDFAKIYALNALLLPASALRKMLELYGGADVRAYAGGILFEYAWQKGRLDDALSHLAALACPGLEVSENYVSLSADERAYAIAIARDRGFDVLYEFGRKRPGSPLRLAELEARVEEVTALGVEHVLVEQSEIDLLVKSGTASLHDLAARAWFRRLLIEADPYRFPAQHVELLQAFGPEANLANVAPGQALRLEGLRRGIGRAVDYEVLAAPR